MVEVPLLEATAAEFAFLVADVSQLLVRRHELAVISVVQLETDRFHIVFDVPPDHPLQTVPLWREQAKVEFGIEVFGDHLRIVVGLEKDLPPVLENGDLVVALFGQSPHQRTVRR